MGFCLERKKGNVYLQKNIGGQCIPMASQNFEAAGRTSSLRVHPLHKLLSNFKQTPTEQVSRKIAEMIHRGITTECEFLVWKQAPGKMAKRQHSCR